MMEVESFDPEEDCGNENYSATHEPKCNKGLGCVACWGYYWEMQDREKEVSNA